MENTIEVIFTIIGLSFWILFPIGIFLSVSRLDKNTDQITRLDHLRYNPIDQENVVKDEVYQPIPFDWHHPILFFRRWLDH